MTSLLDVSAVVIPTYNEAQNIAKLIMALRQLSKGLRIIVIDDGSPDGTGPLAEQLCSQWPPMKVIHRQGKAGRGSACLAGFAAALENPEIRYIVEMDADFSHDPAELPDMLAFLSNGSPDRVGAVIRSRYAKGSSIIDWSPPRRAFSRLANIFARSLLGIPLGDYTNGYRAYTRQAILALDASKIESKGYIVLSEVAYQLHLKGFAFVELPTVFINRRRGESNLGPREIIGAFKGIVALFWKFRNYG